MILYNFPKINCQKIEHLLPHIACRTIRIMQTRNRRLIGDICEKLVMSHIPCPHCDVSFCLENLNHINYNYPGIDLICTHCKAVIQVKSGTGLPTYDTRNKRYKVVASKPRTTLKYFKPNVDFYYIYMQYKTAVDTNDIHPMFCILSQKLRKTDYYGQKKYMYVYKELAKEIQFPDTRHLSKSKNRIQDKNGNSRQR